MEWLHCSWSKIVRSMLKHRLKAQREQVKAALNRKVGAGPLPTHILRAYENYYTDELTAEEYAAYYGIEDDPIPIKVRSRKKANPKTNHPRPPKGLKVISTPEEDAIRKRLNTLEAEIIQAWSRYSEYTGGKAKIKQQYAEIVNKAIHEEKAEILKEIKELPKHLQALYTNLLNRITA